MTTTTPDPYGRGITCPFQRDGKGDFANASGLDVLRSDVGELVGIMGPAADQPGELPWRCDLGTRLITLKHRGIHKELTRATAEHMSAGAIRAWEPRVRVAPTTVSTVDNMLQVNVRYVPLAYQASEVQQVVIQPHT